MLCALELLHPSDVFYGSVLQVSWVLQLSAGKYFVQAL